MFVHLPESGHLAQGQVTSDRAYIQIQDLNPGSFCAAMLFTYLPIIPTQSWGSLRKGYVVPFSGEEAEVTDFGVCLSHGDQKAANLRLEFGSVPPPHFCASEQARSFIIKADLGDKETSAPLVQKSHAFIVSFLQDYINHSVFSFTEGIYKKAY